MAPQTQHAWIVDRRGEPKDALSFRIDWPVPSKLAKGEVLVKVQAAALNPMYVFFGLSRVKIAQESIICA